MTVSEAALADIYQHPADDAPRLIYADWLMEHDAWTWDTVLGHVLHHPQADGLRLLAAHWLDEHDDPERAEFIRVQCDRAGMDPYHLSCTGDKCGLPECNRLRRRERELLHAAHDRIYTNRTAWSENIRHCVDDFLFRRGFVEEVSLTTEDFLRHARDLFRVAPLLRVTLSDREPYQGTAWVRQERSKNPQRVAWELPSRLFDCLRDRVQVGSNTRLVGSHANWYEYDNRNLALSALRAAALLWGRRWAWPCPECWGNERRIYAVDTGREPCPDCHGTGHTVTT